MPRFSPASDPAPAVVLDMTTFDRTRRVYVRTSKGHPYTADVWAPGFPARRIVCPPQINTHARAQNYARSDVDTYTIHGRVLSAAAA